MPELKKSDVAGVLIFAAGLIRLIACLGLVIGTKTVSTTVSLCLRVVDLCSARGFFLLTARLVRDGN